MSRETILLDAAALKAYQDGVTYLEKRLSEALQDTVADLATTRQQLARARELLRKWDNQDDLDGGTVAHDTRAFLTETSPSEPA